MWSATLKQQLAEEKVTMLKHRLFCAVLPKAFDSLDQPLEDLERTLREEKVIDKDFGATMTSRGSKIIRQVKLDMMTVHIATAEAIGRGHAQVARQEQEKFMSSEHAPVANDSILSVVLKTICARQEHIIKRARYITSCKVSFFDETPTLPTESTGILVGV